LEPFPPRASAFLLHKIIKHKELNLPIALARHLLSEKRYSSMRIWLATKGVHGAYCKKKDLDRDKIASLCGLSSSQSVDFHFERLLECNWIGQCEHNYYFRPISFLCEQYDVKGGAVHTIDLEKELAELQNLLFAICIKALIMYRRFAERNIGRCQQTTDDYKVQIYKITSLSVRLLSTLIGISVSMVHRLKMNCLNIGYLDRKKNSRLVLPYEHCYLYENHYGSLYTYDNAVRLRLADDLYPFIPMKATYKK